MLVIIIGIIYVIKISGNNLWQWFKSVIPSKGWEKISLFLREEFVILKISIDQTSFDFNIYIYVCNKEKMVWLTDFEANSRLSHGVKDTVRKKGAKAGKAATCG